MNFADLPGLQTDLNIVVRLLVIIVLAGVLGWERESAGKAAGLRTHILVGVGSVLFLAIGELLVAKYQSFGDQMRFDPIRIVEAVVTGISFLGAGTIFVLRRKGHVKGLTTAASIWTTAAVGLIVGLEKYILATISTILIFIILRLLNFWEDKEIQKRSRSASSK
jgi:putative Mg2+ transporter-C (MgtC) family protein